MYRIYSVVCVDLCKNVKFVTTNRFFPSDFFQLNCCIASASCKRSVKFCNILQNCHIIIYKRGRYFPLHTVTQFLSQLDR